jgi:hypothetical protein
LTVERFGFAETPSSVELNGQLVDGCCGAKIFGFEVIGHPEGSLVYRLNAFMNVDAVDAEIRQLVDDLHIRLFVAAVRHAVEVDIAVHHIDPKRRAQPKVVPDEIPELCQLLGDHRMTGRVGAREPPQTREALQYRQRIEAGCGRGGRTRTGCRGHRPLSARALSATRTSPGFQNRNRSRARSPSSRCRPVVPA